MKFIIRMYYEYNKYKISREEYETKENSLPRYVTPLGEFNTYKEAKSYYENIMNNIDSTLFSMSFIRSGGDAGGGRADEVVEYIVNDSSSWAKYSSK